MGVVQSLLPGSPPHRAEGNGGGPCVVGSSGSLSVRRSRKGLHHGPVAPSTLLHELQVGALLADRAFFEKEDVMSLLRQAELLRDKQHRWRSPPRALIQELLDLQKHRPYRAGASGFQGWDTVTCQHPRGC